MHDQKIQNLFDRIVNLAEAGLPESRMILTTCQTYALYPGGVKRMIYTVIWPMFQSLKGRPELLVASLAMELKVPESVARELIDELEAIFSEQ